MPDYQMMLTATEKGAIMQAIGALPQIDRRLANIEDAMQKEIFPRINATAEELAALKGAHDAIQAGKPRPSDSRQDLPALKPQRSWWDRVWPNVLASVLSTGTIVFVGWLLYLFLTHGKG
jgi:hypothetical protein